MSNNNEQGGEERVVSVTEKGQATIPKKFRDKLRIGAPGHVRFRMTTEDILVVEPAEHPTQFRGALPNDHVAPTTLLRSERRQDYLKEKHDINRHINLE